MIRNVLARFTKKHWLIFSIIIFCCWIPYFLTYFPGILTSDSISSIEQAFSVKALSNHHPVLFTAIVSLFVHLGLLIFNDINASIALFSLFQMIVMSLILGYATYWLYQKWPNKIFIAVILLFFSLNPIIAIYSITMWKDILFSGITVLLCLFLYDIIKTNGEKLLPRKTRLIYTILIILLAFLRNNGLFIIIALTILFLISSPKKCKPILFKIHTIVILLVLLVQGPVYNLFGIQKSSFVESVGIPIQQIAYTISNNGNISEDQKAYLEKILPLEDWKNSYNPKTVDTIKFHSNFNKAIIDANKTTFIHYWLTIGLQNIPKYLNAWASSTSGYWQPGIYNYLANNSITENPYQIRQTNLMHNIFGFSIYKPSSFIYYNINKMPVVRLIFNISFSVYVVIFYILLILFKKKPKYILPVVPLLVIWITLLIAAPTFCEFRYMFALHLMLPIIISWIIFALHKKHTLHTSPERT